ncbi:MAG: hypothetical protein LUG19_05745 [Desulfovibrio sp.]|uniref:hypothetical protein n=1 Tax=Desulfovibrio sp. TaxID=885 RepID=UPI0025837555|nr:hypothetical protein [Desulfovibrio sp.]MCD7983744.1 hypothetical protein [Desulfovibrio sp.]
MNEQFSLIPVTRSMPTRQHPEISLGYNKSGDLVAVFSPDFLSRDDVALSIGSKVLCGYDAENQRLCICPAREGDTGTRVLGKRPGFAGAGQLTLAARNLPADAPKWEGREAFTYALGEDGAVVVNFKA